MLFLDGATLHRVGGIIILTLPKTGQYQGHTIFVKGFDRFLVEDEIRRSLRDKFGSCGQISRVYIPRDHNTGVSKGFAFIDFEEQNGVSQALKLNGSDLRGYLFFNCM